MNNMIKLSDLWIAAALQATGSELTNIEMDDSGIATFVLKSPETLEDFSTRFWNGKVMVDALKYTSCIRNIKGRIIYLSRHKKYEQKSEGSSRRTYGRGTSGSYWMDHNHGQRF